jgi:hypothetical protein
MSWCEDPADLFRLATLVMSDLNPFAVVDAAYLYGHTPDNELSILEAGLELYQSGATKNLVLCGGGPYLPPNASSDAKVSYSGCGAWRKWLESHGVKSEDIYSIPRPPLSHTGTEAYRFVRLAKICEWKVITVVAWHTLRAFTCTVACALRNYPELLIYARPGTPTPWDEEVLSSQGAVFGTRFDAGINGEWERLNKTWGNVYDVIGAHEVVEYVKHRDTSARRLLVESPQIAVSAADKCIENGPFLS